MSHIRRTQSGERWETVEIPILNVDGNVRTVLWNSATIFDPERRKAIATIAQGQDITDRKQKEEEIAKSLREKEILLKEIHHRVKNNLQIISSLLHLQSASSGAEADLLRESQNRIKSISLVHEILYQSKDLSGIRADHYLRELVNRILRTYDAGMISVSFDVEDIEFKINTAIPCGLIVNELVTNSVKHAFPEKKGSISISLRSRGENSELVVSDDGSGMPAGIDLENAKSLGLKLVRSLADQLEGRIECSNENGTRFKITFPKG